MLNYNPWIQFPPHLNKPTIRSLSLNFILQEIAESISLVQGFNELEGRSLELISFFRLNKPYPSTTLFPGKLCFYSNILMENSLIQDSTLRVELDKMSGFILKTKAMLAIQSNNLDESFLKEFNAIMRSCFSSLLPYIYEAKSDENVLIKILEVKNTFETVLGSGAILAIFQEFFPRGPSHFRTLVHEGLTRRGFTLFLSEIESIIDAIEWEPACQPKS